MSSTCQHADVSLQVYDQTIGVMCHDCSSTLHVEWGDDHIPPALEARAARNPKCFDGDGCSAETIVYLDRLAAGEVVE